MYNLTHLATAATATQPHAAAGLLGLAMTITILGVIFLMLKHTLKTGGTSAFKWKPVVEILIAGGLIVWILGDPPVRLGMFGDAIGSIVVDLLGLVKETFSGGAAAVTPTP